jgi:hypothetical protein
MHLNDRKVLPSSSRHAARPKASNFLLAEVVRTITLLQVKLSKSASHISEVLQGFGIYGSVFFKSSLGYEAEW